MRGFFGGRLTGALLGLAMLWPGAQTVRAQEDTGQALDRLQEQTGASPERLDLVLALGNAAVVAGKLDWRLPASRKFWKIWSRIRERRVTCICESAKPIEGRAMGRPQSRP